MNTIGKQLRELRLRADLSLEQAAQAMGLARASSAQHYEDDFKKACLPLDKVAALAKVLVRRGDPPIPDERLPVRRAAQPARNCAGPWPRPPDTGRRSARDGLSAGRGRAGSRRRGRRQSHRLPADRSVSKSAAWSASAQPSAIDLLNHARLASNKGVAAPHS